MLPTFNCQVHARWWKAFPSSRICSEILKNRGENFQFLQFSISIIKHVVARQRIMNFIWSLKVSICFTQSFTNKYKSFGMHFSFILGSYFSLKERCGLWTEWLWGYGNSTSTHYQLSTQHKYDIDLLDLITLQRFKLWSSWEFKANQAIQKS